ncbi:MAG: hypothetical protein QOI95_3097 [Acidimicrobiaceae bacterium]|jgi:hypothetical protein
MSDSFGDSLRDELVTAARRARYRQTRRRRMGALATFGATLLIAVLAGAQLLHTDRAEAGVDIKVENGQLVVRLTDLEFRSDVIRDALARAGLHVTVSAQPVGPSDVGRFVSAVGAGAAPPRELHALSERDGTFEGFVLPVGWPGELDLIVGRPATATETYFKASNAFAAGEPLACSHLLGQALRDIAGHVRTGVRLRVLVVSVNEANPVPVTLEEAIRANPDLQVAGAKAFSSSDVVVLATTTGQLPGTTPTASSEC